MNQSQVISFTHLQLLEDPIFIPVSQLEQDRDGNPAEFSLIEEGMRKGETGICFIEKAKDGKARVRTSILSGDQDSMFNSMLLFY